MEPISNNHYSFTPPKGESLRDSAERSIDEARRLLVQDKVTGVDALRLYARISQAEQVVGKGNPLDAKRIAQDALRKVKDLVDDSNAAAVTSSNDKNKPSSVKNNSTPAADSLGVEGDGVFQRDTTLYQDGSDDSGISFQYAQPLTPAQAPFAVRQHELSHVRRETSDAILEGRRVIASVTVHQRIDPESGKINVEGGRARAVIFPKAPVPESPMLNPDIGNLLDQRS